MSMDGSLDGVVEVKLVVVVVVVVVALVALVVDSAGSGSNQLAGAAGDWKDCLCIGAVSGVVGAIFTWAVDGETEDVDTFDSSWRDTASSKSLISSSDERLSSLSLDEDIL